MAWSHLHDAVKKIPNVSHSATKPTRTASEKDILEELLKLARAQQAAISNPVELLPQAYLQRIMQNIVDQLNVGSARPPLNRDVEVPSQSAQQIVSKHDELIATLTNVIEEKELSNNVA